MQTFHLQCSGFSVEVRLREVNGRWIASADTPDGPSLGCGVTAFAALWEALQPFDGAIDQLLASLPLDT